MCMAIGDRYPLRSIEYYEFPVNLVEILESAVDALPSGEYSTGLQAIVRHVKAAIRHLERDREHDPDTCTDAIYRMNQAYEGSLKEAYRVLAGKDPAGLSPYKIENYLETNSIVRPRVLTQLTRYRQDYRNPSTHDYKLDFDEDEALLAIVSVCAFAKLLVNQIASKLASEAAQLRAVARSPKSSRASLRSLGKSISAVCLAYTVESGEVDWFEYERGLAESLRTAGFDADVVPGFDDATSDGFWDVVVKKGKSHFGIDVRVDRRTSMSGSFATGGYLESVMAEGNCSGALLVLRSLGSSDYRLYRGQASGKIVYVICGDDSEQLAKLGENLGALQLVVTR